MGEELGSNSRAIGSSNIGYKLLKKQGWKEGTGLGISEQGRLVPLQTHVKNDKRGLGAEKKKKNTANRLEDPVTESADDNEQVKSKKKHKTSSKRVRKMQEEDKRMQEKEFEQAFFREFWPDNV
eukprot:TRINITY_DN11907_c0_g1_i1.p1 TRINITY_DN11907_c0_g1~~TRINITY_DN11907_c0_g1_i1.p1  ORF type:complete len:135 (-),score=26.52 TRINITY_DN11907_c0_g1_i1:193-564(-)